VLEALNEQRRQKGFYSDLLFCRLAEGGAGTRFCLLVTGGGGGGGGLLLEKKVKKYVSQKVRRQGRGRDNINIRLKIK
jgi:hypothetical protein